MIDFEAQPAVKRATARLKAGRWYGTGYLVRPDRVATCYHVVKDLAAGTPIQCTFADDAHTTRTAVVDVVDADADCALLKLELAMTVDPLRLSSARPAFHFWTFGFPAFTAGVGLSIGAELLDPDTVSAEGHRAFSMYSKQFAGDLPTTMGGLSGSPVLVGGVVVGHMSSVLGAMDAAQVPHLGQAYAVGAAGVMRLLGEPTVSMAQPPVRDRKAAEAAEVTVANQARVFLEIEASASGTEVNAALERGRVHGAVSDEALLFAGNRLLELDLIDDAIAMVERVPETPQRQRDLAVAYSLRGDHAQAQALLKPLTDSHSRAIEGGTLKRRWLETGKTMWLQAACDAYEAGYAIDGDHYPGINAAYCAFELGRRSDGERIAREIIARLQPIATRDKWQEASLAEAHLLTGDLEAARVRYQAAAKKHLAQWRNLAIMRRQARKILELLGQPRASFDAIFPVPATAAFTGHRVDPDETRGRFAPSRVDGVKRRLARALEERDVQFGFSSAADGGDILFLEALLERGGEAHVYLPFPADAFASSSVAQAWQDRFHALIQKLGRRVVVLSDQMPESGPLRDAGFANCNAAIQEAARHHAGTLDEPPLLIAVVAGDGTDGTGGVGGAHDAVRRWIDRGDRVFQIDPRTV
ncbi:MAG TPA: tetratricopeptide repeat-containing protein [Kofleriaceae bacterium]